MSSTTTTTVDPSSSTPSPVRRLPAPKAADGHRWRVGSITAAVVVFVVLHGFAVEATEFAPSRLVDGWRGMVSFLADAIPPDLSWAETLRPSLEAALVTLWIGLLGTTFSIPAAMILAVLGARTTTPHPVVYQVARAILSSCGRSPTSSSR